MFHNAKPPERATPAALECDLLAGTICSENSYFTDETQRLRERYLRRRIGHWEHISAPVARVIAELAFSTERARA